MKFFVSWYICNVDVFCSTAHIAALRLEHDFDGMWLTWCSSGCRPRGWLWRAHIASESHCARLCHLVHKKGGLRNVGTKLSHERPARREELELVSWISSVRLREMLVSDSAGGAVSGRPSVWWRASLVSTQEQNARPSEASGEGSWWIAYSSTVWYE
jgi:hypothetical protein